MSGTTGFNSAYTSQNWYEQGSNNGSLDPNPQENFDDSERRDSQATQPDNLYSQDDATTFKKSFVPKWKNPTH